MFQGPITEGLDMDLYKYRRMMIANAQLRGKADYTQPAPRIRRDSRSEAQANRELRDTRLPSLLRKQAE